MNKLQLFTSEQFGQIRSLVIDDVIWFSGKDVAEALGYKNTTDALCKHVEEDDKRQFLRSQFAKFLTTIPNRGLLMINESGLYALVLSSKLKTACEFKRWITHDVIPAIRKTGSYSVTGQEQSLAISPKDMKALAKAVAKELQSQEVKALPPKKHCIYVEEVNAYKLRFMEEAVRGMEQLNADDCSVICSFISGLLAGIKKKALRLAGML